ncbi:Bacterial regulatory proteins, tetR family [Paraliobacillus sp. PM-2]|uniref:TetR/AcrR family transcriptional regulator n=1 Tax=Paraliobacillus sp. PM-2 TaxID=1462524 RepID=UPI00061C4F2D|nr:TetR/AcrR family transcriptional regulator [Paraliobacillus sp. PM-2]CQR46359.1 Bacterial regulatory proteins, tetR family [Paraliobacillus sp. PM-2]
MKNRKTIQRERMWRYFLDGAVEIIEEEGVEQITIRKIAERAGYTSSTAYNYFKDLSHLKFFAAMHFTTNYINDLPTYVAKGKNTVEKWLYAWQCFCLHSFDNPHIYSIIFTENLGDSPKDMLASYYDVFSMELVGLPEEIKPIIMEHDFSKRSALYIAPAVTEGFIQQKDVERISDMTFMIWKGIMSTYMNQRRKWTKEEAIEITLSYVKELVMHYIAIDKQSQINFNLNN